MAVLDVHRAVAASDLSGENSRMKSFELIDGVGAMEVIGSVVRHSRVSEDSDVMIDFPSGERSGFVGMCPSVLDTSFR